MNQSHRIQRLSFSVPQYPQKGQSISKFWVFLLFLLMTTAGCAHTRTDPSSAEALDGSSDSADLKKTSLGQQHAKSFGRSKPSATGTSKVLLNSRSSKSAKETPTVLDEALDFCQASQEFWQKGELDNALEALDQAYSLILQADNQDDPEELQEKEDLRFMISKRILEIYASRNIVVNGHHNAIPMEMNADIQAEIDSFTSKNREQGFFIRSYKRSGMYRAYIVQALKEAGIPEELSWLPLIESGFKVNAMSHARALGLWQFISSTGYKFGLTRDAYIDERLDPVKATHAAIAYLKELHQIFGDWTTVLAAYNCGEGRVLKIIRNQNVNYLDNFWDLYAKLPRETARYVPRFLATLHILKNPAKYGLDQVDVFPPLEFKTVPIEKRVHLRDVAKAVNVKEADLKALNPELRVNIVPGDGYELRVPVPTSELLIARLSNLPEYKKPAQQQSSGSLAYYRVRPGDTLSTIARRHRTSVNQIMRANNMRKGNYIVVGQRLKIPQKDGSVSASVPAKAPNQTVSQTTHTYHVVKRGDSLWIIARQYGTTTQKIQAANGMRSTRLNINQRLKIPGSKERKQTVDSSGYKVYRVQRGDSPFRIAQAHKMTLEQLLRINSLTPRSRIYPGQSLMVE